MSAKDYRLLVFDWDGTVMDSLATIVACFQGTARELELPPVEEVAIRGAVGLSLADTLDRLVPSADSGMRERIVATYRRRWRQHHLGQSRPFAGAVDTLHALSAEGYQLAVATGKGRHGLERDLETCGLDGMFAALRTADQGLSKPHPQILLDLLEELGAQAPDALMIGDALWDLEMAANAGVDAVAVATGAHDREQLLRRRPLTLLPALSDLPAWLAERPAAEDQR